MHVARKVFSILLRNRDNRVGQAGVASFRFTECAPFLPVEESLDGMVGGFKLLLPKISLHVVREKNFWTRQAPINEPRRINEITDQRVEIPTSYHAVEAATYRAVVEIAQPASGFPTNDVHAVRR